MYKIWTACNVIAKTTSVFENMAVTPLKVVMNLEPVFLKNFGEHQPAY